MHSTSFARFFSATLFLLTAVATRLPAQELLSLELEAMQQRAAGDDPAAAMALVRLAQQTSQAEGDAVQAARVEAWITAAAQWVSPPAVDLLAPLDAIGNSALATQHPLLADRVARIAMQLTGDRRDLQLAERCTRLGFVRDLWLVGPFANERGSGFRTVLPPEQELDLDAELPGKRRPVTWRLLPPLTGQPTWSLATIVNPHEQSLVYAAVAIVAERATDAVLELGSTGSFAVFVNGVEAASRDVERPFAYDQEAVPISLLAGSNLCLLKLCHQEGRDFEFAVRLRSRTGGPLAGVTVTTAKDTLRSAAATKATAAEGPTPTAAEVALGGRSTWSIGKATGADALRLSWLWAAGHADGDRDRRDLAAAKAAATALPELAESHLQVAASSVRHVRSAADTDDNDRRRALERALACEADHVEALVQLGNLLRSSSRLWREAQSLADKALARRPGHADAMLLRAATLRDQGLEAVANWELTASTTPSSPIDLRRAAANALAGSDPQRALVLRQSAWQQTGDENDAVGTAWLLLGTGHQAEAATLLQQVVVADPYALRARRQLANLQLELDHPRDSLQLLEAWLTINPDDADTIVLAGRAYRLLAEQQPDVAGSQLQLLREALAIEPERRDDERYAEFLAAGSGTETAFHTPYQIDAKAAVSNDTGPPADAATNKDALHWLLRQQVVRANGNGTTNTYQHEIVRILNEDGARMLQRYQLRHYRGEQRSRLLSCSVFHQDGSVERPALQGSSVRLPNLGAGDVVAVEGRIDDLAPSFFGDYFGSVHFFAAPEGSPVRSSEFVVLAEPGRDYRWQATNGAPEPERETLADGTLRFRWRMQDLPRDVPEFRRPDRKELQPLVRMTTYRDWDQFAAWWWNLIKNQLEVTPAMRRTVEQLCAGRDSIDAKIAAIYHFVTTDVRYEAWEFGVHGYKPYSTAVIYERRHGDCKDKALLLCALLGQIGVEGRPVLIFADSLRSQDDLTLPMVEHFNHCIAWLPAQGGRPARFLDGTATWHPTDTTPEMDQGADVLVVDAGKALLRHVDFTTPQKNLEQSTFTIDLAADGKAVLRVEQHPLGNRAVDLREMLATEPARRQEIFEQRLVRRFGKLDLTSVEASSNDDPEAAVQLTTTAALAELGQQTGSRWQLPSTWDDTDLQSLAGDSERRTPVLLGTPQGSHTTVRYRVPPGWRIGALPAAVSRTTPFGDFKMQWRRDGDDVVIDRTLEFVAPRVAVTEHEALRTFVTAVKAADSQLVLLQKEGR